MRGWNFGRGPSPRLAWLALVAALYAGVALAINWPTVELGDFLTSGLLTKPVYLTHAGDGSGRVFVVEQPGTVRIIQNGALVGGPPFLNITNRVVLGTGVGDERGCLGLAFPPQFASKKYFYVYYYGMGATTETRLSRFRVTTNNVNLADANSEQILMRITEPQANHNGGQIMFGPDGYLYLCIGDGGNSYDENPAGGSGHALNGNAQMTSTNLGKILRIDVESPPVTNRYQIPPDNPYVGNTNVLPEIWAYGLRNPYRCSFDRATGDLWIGDVGQGAYEEIDYQPAGDPGGENYGWRRYEATNCTHRANDPPCDEGTNLLTFPIYTYTHIAGRCALIGGYVHRGLPVWSFLNGVYLYGDYCSHELFGLKWNGTAWASKLLFTFGTGFVISAFGEDEAGNVYVCNINNGAIRRVDEVLLDTDHDQMPDAYEIYYGFQTNNAADGASNADADGDGLANVAEYVAGTDPTNPASCLTLDDIETPATNAVVLQWPSVAGRRYGVRASSNLVDGFAALATNLPATPPANLYTVNTAAAASFYAIDARTNGP